MNSVKIKKNPDLKQFYDTKYVWAKRHAEPCLEPFKKGIRLGSPNFVEILGPQIIKKKYFYMVVNIFY